MEFNDFINITVSNNVHMPSIMDLDRPNRVWLKEIFKHFNDRLDRVRINDFNKNNK